MEFQNFRDFDKNWGCNLSASDLKAVLQYLDDDNSGSVSLQELQKGMNRAVREVAEAQAKLEPQVTGPATNAYDTRRSRFWKILEDEFKFKQVVLMRL